MRCPVCEHDNSDFATRCASCGAELPQTPQADVEAPTAVEAEPPLTVTMARHMRPNPLEETEDGNLESEPPLEERTVDVGATRERQGDWKTSVEDEPEPDFDLDGEIDFDEEIDYDEFDGGSGELRRHHESRRHKVVTAISSHQRGLGIALAITVIVVLGITWLFLSFAGAPAQAKIADDLALHLPTYTYAGGTFGVDEEIALTSLEIIRLDPTDVPDQAVAASGVGPSAYLCDAEATYKSEHLQVTRAISSTYIRTDDGWQMMGDLAADSVSLEPLAGVDTDKMLSNVSELFQLAQSDGDTDLASIYAGGSFSVAGERFDKATPDAKATDSVTIGCSKASTFYSHEGTLNARFAFEEGGWHLEAAQVEEGAATRNYAPLIGIWEGSAIDHDASGKVCYGAEELPVSVVIESIGETTGNQTSVSGTIYGIVHAHGELERSEMSNAQDIHIEMVPFEGSLIAGYDTDDDSDLTLEATVDYTLPESADTDDKDEEDPFTIGRTTPSTRPGSSSKTTQPTTPTKLEVTFVVHFNTNDNGESSVICEVTSTYTYEEVVFLVVPRETQARFTDTYRLTRAE